MPGENFKRRSLRTMCHRAGNDQRKRTGPGNPAFLYGAAKGRLRDWTSGPWEKAWGAGVGICPGVCLWLRHPQTSGGNSKTCTPWPDSPGRSNKESAERTDRGGDSGQKPASGDSPVRELSAWPGNCGAPGKPCDAHRRRGYRGYSVRYRNWYRHHHGSLCLGGYAHRGRTGPCFYD